ncbi:MAG TPA: alpha/beta hydrolase [Acidimicrobiales bacterium]
MDVTADVDELAQARRTNALVEEVLAAAPPVHTVDPVVTRRERAEGRGVFPAPVRLDVARTVHVPGPAGDIPVRVLAPDRVAGVYLHLHGGGWVLGAADQQDPWLWQLATGAGVAVASVEYRLAPEHPYPAGPDDCEAVAGWLLAGGAAELGSERLVIGGESAGAHLAVLTLLRLRDGDGAVPGGRRAGPAFAGANLVFGAFDLSGTPSLRRWGDRNLILSRPIVDWFIDCFTPGRTPEDRRDPAVSPLYADLTGLPPALFVVGDLDPVLDDSLFMAARWRAAGNRVDLAVFPESIHGFTAFPGNLAARAQALQVAFVRRAIGA